MFERTIATLGRLFRWGSTTAAEEERRSWVRHACDVETTCRPAGDGEAELPAQVRDVALGGASVVVRRPFAPGDLLSLRLPGEQPATTVLACVVRADPLDDERWSLGCTFSAEITEADLLLFEPQRAVVRVPEQRAAERHPCQARATYQRVNNGTAPKPATVVNVSLNGIALQAGAPLAAGELLSLDLSDAAGRAVASPLVCVVRITSQPGGDWLFGCNFMSELTEEQLRALL
jgi:hypothetical protein